MIAPGIAADESYSLVGGVAACSASRRRDGPASHWHFVTAWLWWPLHCCIVHQIHRISWYYRVFSPHTLFELNSDKMAGARVVPIFYNASPATIDSLFAGLNGVCKFIFVDNLAVSAHSCVFTCTLCRLQCFRAAALHCQLLRRSSSPPIEFTKRRSRRSRRATCSLSGERVWALNCSTSCMFRLC